MRELFFKLFSDTPFGASVTIVSFNIWHILYILIIFGGAISAAILMRNKDMSVKEKTLKILAYLLVISYVADFFVHDFVYADYVDGAYEAAGLNMDKLPFHICTVLCPIIAFVQFNKNSINLSSLLPHSLSLRPLCTLRTPARA